jgi:hypothetical protein
MLQEQMLMPGKKPKKAAKSSKKAKPAKRKAAPRTKEKKPQKAKKAAPSVKKPKKVEVTPRLMRNWLRIRKAWNISLSAFGNILSLLSDEEAEEMYELVRLSLFKSSYAEILHEHPQLRPILRSDQDRHCMHDIYEAVSFRLDKREELPPDRKISQRMKGRIGREVPVYE